MSPFSTNMFNRSQFMPSHISSRVEEERFEGKTNIHNMPIVQQKVNDAYFYARLNFIFIYFRTLV